MEEGSGGGGLGERRARGGSTTSSWTSGQLLAGCARTQMPAARMESGGRETRGRVTGPSLAAYIVPPPEE